MVAKDKRIEILVKENEELRAENTELRKFVMYVRGLKTDADFLALKTTLENASFLLNQKQKWKAK